MTFDAEACHWEKPQGSVRASPRSPQRILHQSFCASPGVVPVVFVRARPSRAWIPSASASATRLDLVERPVELSAGSRRHTEPLRTAMGPFYHGAVLTRDHPQRRSGHELLQSVLVPPSGARSSAGKRPTSAPAFRGGRLLGDRLDRSRAGRLPHRGVHAVHHRRDTFLSGGGACEIIVRAEDDPADLAKPRGKQDWQLEPHSIWYPRTTGIWQTVWLERVPSTWVATV